MPCASVLRPEIAPLAGLLLDWHARGVKGRTPPGRALPNEARLAYLAGAESRAWLDGSEHGEQVVLFRWLDLLAPHWPELVGATYAVPNGGLRSKAAAGKLKAEGVRAGIPDICVPVPAGEFASLRIELKAASSGAATASQRRMAPMLEALGNRVVVCHGWELAAREITTYLWPAS